MSKDIAKTLQERTGIYGDFTVEGEISQHLKQPLRQHAHSLLPYQQEALELIFMKISRIINGDPSYVDNWLDIEGYARLVRNRLELKGSGEVAQCTA